MELINKSKAYDTIYNICLTADASNEYREGFECGKSLACVAIKKMERELPSVANNGQEIAKMKEQYECAFVNLKKQYEQKINDLGVEIEDCKLKIDICENLARYEDLGVTPDQIREIDELYTEKCEEVNQLKKQLESESERI